MLLCRTGSAGARCSWLWSSDAKGGEATLVRLRSVSVGAGGDVSVSVGEAGVVLTLARFVNQLESPRNGAAGAQVSEATVSTSVGAVEPLEPPAELEAEPSERTEATLSRCDAALLSVPAPVLGSAGGFSDEGVVALARENMPAKLERPGVGGAEVLPDLLGVSGVVSVEAGLGGAAGASVVAALARKPANVLPSLAPHVAVGALAAASAASSESRSVGSGGSLIPVASSAPGLAPSAMNCRSARRHTSEASRASLASSSASVSLRASLRARSSSASRARSLPSASARARGAAVAAAA